MRVSLSPVRRTLPSDIAPPLRALLAAGGPRLILGGGEATELAEPIAPTASTLFGPRGLALASAQGPLFVADTGHHRLLVWSHMPDRDGAPAAFLIGQPDFSREGRNAKGPVGAATLNVPTGVAAADGVLAVADAWNHRVLLWHGYPTRSNQPADVVLGQADFVSNLANRGSDEAGADTLNWCYGVTLSQGALYVADTGNRRVLKWNQVPTQNGAPADLVLGQENLTRRDENGGEAANARSMRWPHALLAVDGRLYVADAGNNRIMVWQHAPAANGLACDIMIGQRDMAGVDHNQTLYYPRADTLNMPYGLAWLSGELTVADTANSRLLAFDPAALETGMTAHKLAGQASFADKGDNRWGRAQRDSLCWPYGLASAGHLLGIADSGNNRVMLWEAAP